MGRRASSGTAFTPACHLLKRGRPSREQMAAMIATYDEPRGKFTSRVGSIYLAMRNPVLDGATGRGLNLAHGRSSGLDLLSSGL
jgi:hypothetical protein